MTETQNITPTQDEPLPCRGCQASCPNYHQCDGKVWRMVDEVVEPAQ